MTILETSDNTALSCGNAFAVFHPDESAGPGPVVSVRTGSSSSCVFLTADRRDCMAFLERCAWCISQGLCIRPGAVVISYRGL